MSVQFASKLLLPSFCLYCHLVSVPPPLTVAVRVSLPLPAPALAETPVGVPGSVRKSSLASSVEQPLSLYAFQV